MLSAFYTHKKIATKKIDIGSDNTKKTRVRHSTLHLKICEYCNVTFSTINFLNRNIYVMRTISYLWPYNWLKILIVIMYCISVNPSSGAAGGVASGFVTDAWRWRGGNSNNTTPRRGGGGAHTTPTTQNKTPKLLSFLHIYSSLGKILQFYNYIYTNDDIYNS